MKELQAGLAAKPVRQWTGSIARGIAKQSSNGDLVTNVRQFVTDLLSRRPAREVEYGFLVRQIREEVGEFVWAQIRSHPMILPVVTEI